MLIMLHAINHNHFNSRASISHVLRYTHTHTYETYSCVNLWNSTHVGTFQKVPKEFIPKYIWPFDDTRSIVSTTVVDVVTTAKNNILLLNQREFEIISYDFKYKQHKKLTKYLLSYSFFLFFCSLFFFYLFFCLHLKYKQVFHAI